MAVRPIDANELYRIEKLLDTDIVRKDKVALNLLEQVLYDIQHVPTLTPPNEPRAGLYGKYTVYKNKDGSLVTDCFILRPAKDPAAVAALREYAAITDNAELAADIINWVGAEPNEPLTIEQLLKMDGEPVWVEDVKHWALIDIEKGGQWDGMPFAIWAENGTKFTYNIKNRGLYCYRRPPEGEEDT